MGNAESAVVRNVDKRTSRREHRETFEAAAQRFRAAPFPPVAQLASANTADRRIRVCVRKRPIFPHELQQSEFDAITCLPNRVVVHDARMHPDMVHMFMNHHDFAFDETFDESADNSTVYGKTALDLVGNSLDGGHGTVMMYGQTGSGKTFTMMAIYECVARDIFSQLGDRIVTVCFIELLGDNCFDMLNQGGSCNLSTAPDGSVHPFPSVEVEVSSASELLALISMATRLRATAATGVHDQSSRSHALCRIFVGSPDESGSGIDMDSEGSLTLVDLAGSEHRIDNAEHNAERRKEGAKINQSLAALKECVRSTAAGAKFVAFRQNRLTQLLRGCFVGVERHDTVIVATVSPSSKDTEHSLNTLRHACIMDGQGEAKTGQSSHLQGGHVTKELLGEIDVTRIARERKASRKNSEPGRPEEPKPAPAHQSKQSNTGARAALDRRCLQALPAGLARKLMEARGAFGSLRQRKRFSRLPSAPPGPSAGAKAERGDVGRCEGGEAEASVRPGSGKAAQAQAPGTGGESVRAFELFRAFCQGGRAARDWRKNDLRLISSAVLPLVYGPGTCIDWAHPNAALDELERLVAKRSDKDNTGPSLKKGGEVHSQVLGPSKPPALPPSASAPSSAGGQRVRESLRSAPERVLSDDQLSARQGAPRSASPAGRGTRTPVLDPGACIDSAGPVSHQDAIRARRAALELQRKQSLEQALAKNKLASMTREEEIQSIEQQLAAGSFSTAAMTGMKKRLAALKAVSLRQERAVTRAAGTVASPETDGHSAAPQEMPSESWLPEPARPPLRPGSARRHSAQLGAAAAPWANECSPEALRG